MKRIMTFIVSVIFYQHFADIRELIDVLLKVDISGLESILILGIVLPPLSIAAIHGELCE